MDKQVIENQEAQVAQGTVVIREVAKNKYCGAVAQIISNCNVQ